MTADSNIRWLALPLAMSAALWTLAGAATAFADEPTEWSTRAQWGVEYDDNPPRLEHYDGGGDASTRYLLGGDVSSRISPSLQVATSFRHGGKFFRRETDHHAMVTRAAASATFRPFSSVYARPTADVKDRTRPTVDDEERSLADNRLDYTRGGLALQLGARFGPVQPWVEAGGRFFAFKPRPTGSHRGLRARAGLRWRARDDLAIDAVASRTRRAHGTVAWRLDGDRFVQAEDGTRRRDIYHLAQLSAQYRGPFDARLRVQHARNSSNSYGQAMHRYAAAANLTTPIAWQIVASGRAEVQWTRYEDPVRIDDITRIDEENRNTFAFALSRPLVDPWEIEMRYDLYFQEFGAGRDYMRQILAISVGVHLDGT